MKARIVLLLLLALCVVVAAQPAQPDDADWSPVVYPLQRLPLIFSHQKHLARGAASEACHPNATSSQSADDNLLPTELQCRARPPTRCAASISRPRSSCRRWRRASRATRTAKKSATAPTVTSRSSAA